MDLVVVVFLVEVVFAVVANFAAVVVVLVDVVDKTEKNRLLDCCGVLTNLPPLGCQCASYC